MNSSTSIVYEKVTNLILDQLNAGVIPWRKPWVCRGGANSPRNFISKKAYRGINLWLLAGAETPFWLTFNQARQIGAKVKKGEKASTVVFWSVIPDKKHKPAPGEKQRNFWLLRYFSVFNVAQCEGISDERIASLRAEFSHERAGTFDSVGEAENIVSNFIARDGKLVLKHGGDRACYSPALDYVQLPEAVDFQSPSAYYSTAFHELGHATGHQSRLAREGVIKGYSFGSEGYAKEELVAEFCATFLLGTCDLVQPDIENSAAYIASWKKHIKEDAKLIIRAASQAQRAADYILGEGADVEGEEEESELATA